MFIFNSNIISLLLAPVFRKTKVVSLLRELFGYDQYGVPSDGIALVGEELIEYRSAINSELPYTGQVLSLEHLLSQERPGYVQADVEIEDADRTAKTYLHNYGEAFNTVYLSNYDEPDSEPLYFMNHEEYNIETDFIVRVLMNNVGSEYKKRMRATIDKFKIAGKTYEILGQDE